MSFVLAVHATVPPEVRSICINLVLDSSFRQNKPHPPGVEQQRNKPMTSLLGREAFGGRSARETNMDYRDRTESQFAPELTFQAEKNGLKVSIFQ